MDVVGAFKLLELGPGESLAWGRTFRRIEIAEEELAAGKAAHPELVEQIDELFICCKAMGLPLEAPDVFMRMHVRELVDRVAEDLGAGLKRVRVEEPTQVEMAAVILEASLKAPLRSEFVRWLMTAKYLQPIWQATKDPLLMEGGGGPLSIHEERLYLGELRDALRRTVGADRLRDWKESRERMARLAAAEEADRKAAEERAAKAGQPQQQALF